MPKLHRLVVLALSFAASNSFAQTTVYYPILRGLDPIALQVGTTTELEVRASNDLRGASQVIVTGDGVRGEVVPPEAAAPSKPGEAPKELTRLKVRFTATADALPGPRQVRLVTPRGASTLAELVVVRDPVVSETGDNNTPAKAQPIATLPAVICGQIEAKEDVDCFRFHVDGPRSLVFHVWAQRLQHVLNDLRGRRFIDPILTLRSATGATLATSDNVSEDDPLLSYQFLNAGDYVLEIRDVRFHGWGEYWGYAIEIHDRPLITQVFPLTVTPGQESSLSLVGFNLPNDPRTTLTLPPETADGICWVSPPVSGKPANSVAVVATRLPRVIETTADNNLFSAGQLVSVPSSIAGRIETEGDVDGFRFEAKKGEQFSFECIARRAGSPLDPALRILDDTGQQLVEIDDLKYSLFTLIDSELEGWTAPRDGTFTLEVRDLVSNGGPQFVYAVNVTRSQPRFLLEANSDKTLLAPGIGSPIYVRVDRRNGFTGDVQLEIEGLPPGVTAECGRILSTGVDGCIILRASATAPAGAANIRITGTATHTQPDGTILKLSTVARPLQEIQQDGGGRGLVPVSLHTVTVANPMEVLAMRLVTNEVTLKPGQSQRIDVTLERAPDYKGNITLDAIYQHLGIFGDSLPKGVTVDPAASETILTGDKVTGHITLKAAPTAPPAEKQLVPLMAHVTITFTLKQTFCEPLRVTVSPTETK